MVAQQYWISSAHDSNSHGAPHVEGRRVAVRDTHTRVDRRGLAFERVAERYDMSIATSDEALAADHGSPAAMRRVEKHHQRATADATERSSLTPPENRPKAFARFWATAGCEYEA